MYGRNLLNTNSILPTRVSADNSPLYKPGGITIDWNIIAAPAADVTLADGSIVRAGNKYIRYGQVMTEITVAGGDTVTINGAPTGGTYTLSVANASGTQTTAGIAYNANAATIQTALQGLSNVGAGNATVTGTGPFTVAFANLTGTETLTANGAGLTGGTNPSVTVAQTSDNNVGMYGPYDPNATDGRQNLNRGQAYIADETILQYEVGNGQVVGPTDQTGRMIEGGLVWLARILNVGTGSATLAGGPTLANVNATFPMLRYAQN